MQIMVRAAAALVGAAMWSGAGGGTAASVEAQRATAGPSGPAAFLFEYRLKPGMESLFEEGYRRHLEWHRRKKDPLPWYGWQVSTGDRVGVFIDGSFGVPFGAFDARVEPAADGADFDQTAGAFAEPLSRRVYRLRAELSTAQPLEDRAPAANLDVMHIAVKPASARAFENALAAIRDAKGSSRLRYTCYELIVGGELPSYLLMVARDGWSAYDTAPAPAAILSGSFLDAAKREEIETAIGESVSRAVSETWTYRPELSLVGGR